MFTKNAFYKFIHALLGLSLSIGYATVLYVHPDSVLNSIQTALDSCALNDTILVGPGIYYECCVWPSTQGINLMSELGPDTTIIDANNVGTVISISSSVTSSTVITGFTICNGDGVTGGGIDLQGAYPTIRNNIITENTATHGGGLSSMGSSAATIVNNIITYNEAENTGGGILIYSQASTIDSNTIANNVAQWGAGIFCQYYAGSVITNNMFSENAASATGGGIDCYFSSPSIEGNILTTNVANYGGGINCWTSDPTIQYNLIHGNIASGRGGGISCMDFSSPTIHGDTITLNSGTGAGIYCESGSTPFIDSCTIADNGGAFGIYITDGADPTIHYNNIINNRYDAIHNGNPSLTIDAENNWWGDATGPYHPDSNPSGQGDTVSDFIDFSPWLTHPVGIEEETSSKNLVRTLQTYPNPFSKLTTITCSREHSAESIELRIFDVSGRCVKSFQPLPDTPRSMQIRWNGTDDARRKLPSGVYFLELTTGSSSITKKVLLVR